MTRKWGEHPNDGKGLLRVSKMLNDEHSKTEAVTSKKQVDIFAMLEHVHGSIFSKRMVFYQTLKELAKDKTRDQGWAIAWPDALGHLSTNDWRTAYVAAFGNEPIPMIHSPVETNSPQAPIAKLTMAEWGPAGVSMYAPGLPPGEHDLYCEPPIPSRVFDLTAELRRYFESGTLNETSDLYLLLREIEEMRPAQETAEKLCPKCEQPMARHMSNATGTVVNECPTLIATDESDG